MIDSAFNSRQQETTVTKAENCKDKNYIPFTLISKVTPNTKNNPPSLMPENKQDVRDQESQSTLSTRPSLTSRRSRLVSQSSEKLTAMLQNAKKRQFVNDVNSEESSLVSHSSYSISLDGDPILPPTKTKGFQMTTDLELDDDDNDLEDRENVPCGENNTIASIQEGESVVKLKVQEPDEKDHVKHRYNKIHALRERRQQNKRHRKQEQNKDDTMSTISAITFDCNAAFPQMPSRSTIIDDEESSSNPATYSNMPYLQKLTHHYQNISTTTKSHPSIDAKKMERLESIHDRIMLLQIENYQIKEAYMKLAQHMNDTENPDKVKLNEMRNDMRNIEFENESLKARNLDLEVQVKHHRVKLVEKEKLLQRLTLLSPQKEQLPLSTSIENAATMLQQQKDIELQQNTYMNTRKRLEHKRKLCRDVLKRSSSGSRVNNGIAPATGIVDDEENNSFLSSSLSLSEENFDKNTDKTKDKVNKAQAMVVKQKLNQAEQEIVLLTTKVNTLQQLNGNLLRRFQEKEDDFCSVTKIETSSIQQQQEITNLKGQLKQKESACISMEHQLIAVRTEMMDLKDMHEIEVNQLREEYENIKAEAGRQEDWLKNQLAICQRKLSIMQGDIDVEVESRSDVDHYDMKEYTYDNYERNDISGEGKKLSSKVMATMVENQKIMAEFYRAKQYLHDAHNEAAKADDGFADAAGMEGLSTKEQEDLIAEIAEERKKWKATTTISPPSTPTGGIPLVVEALDTSIHRRSELLLQAPPQLIPPTSDEI